MKPIKFARQYYHHFLVLLTDVWLSENRNGVYEDRNLVHVGLSEDRNGVEEDRKLVHVGLSEDRNGVQEDGKLVLMLNSHPLYSWTYQDKLHWELGVKLYRDGP